MESLTVAEKRVLDGLFSFLQEKGYAPSQLELAKKVGLKSANTVDYHLGKLERKGFVKCPKNRFRAIQLSPTLPISPDSVSLPVLRTTPERMLNRGIQNLPLIESKEVTMDKKTAEYKKSLRDKIISVFRANKVPVELTLELLAQCQSQFRNTLLIERTLKECGLRPTRFLTNEQLELYYDVRQGRHDVGYISKGWDDPGFRIGDIVEIKKDKIEAFKRSIYELLRFCAVNGITFTFQETDHGLELQMDGVIYSEGFNREVFKKTLESLNECVDKALELIRKYSR